MPTWLGLMGLMGLMRQLRGWTAVCKEESKQQRLAAEERVVFLWAVTGARDPKQHVLSIPCFYESPQSTLSLKIYTGAMMNSKLTCSPELLQCWTN